MGVLGPSIIPVQYVILICLFSLLLALFAFQSIFSILFRFRFLIMIIGLIATIFGYQKVVELKSSDPIRERIFLLERYGGEWGGDNERDLVLDNRGIAQNKFVSGKEDYRLTPAVILAESDDPFEPLISLIGIKIFISFPREITITNSKSWLFNGERNGYKVYATSLESIDNGTLASSREPLRMMFPESKPYIIPYSISGRTTAGAFKRIDRTFVLNLVE